MSKKLLGIDLGGTTVKFGILTADGEVQEKWAIETNTLPGFTPTSLLPQQAACNGISYSQLIDLIIEKCLKVKR